MELLAKTAQAFATALIMVTAIKKPEFVSLEDVQQAGRILIVAHVRTFLNDQGMKYCFKSSNECLITKFCIYLTINITCYCFQTRKFAIFWNRIQ